MLNALVRVVGKGRLGLVHANDSKDPLGSGRDRHAPIGVGTIGVDPFAELFVHPAMRGVPVWSRHPAASGNTRPTCGRCRGCATRRAERLFPGFSGALGPESPI